MRFSEKVVRDRKKLSAMKTGKEKALFLWDCYKVPIFSVCMVLFIVIYSLAHAFTGQDTALYTVLINADSRVLPVSEPFFETELEKAGIDMDGRVVNIRDDLTIGSSDNKQADVETLQVVNALFTITDLDLFFSDKDTFDLFGNNDGFADLSLLIDNDILDRHSDALYWYEDTNGNMICGGILLVDSPLQKAGYYHEPIYMGVVANGANMENALAFVRQLLSDF